MNSLRKFLSSSQALSSPNWINESLGLSYGGLEYVSKFNDISRLVDSQYSKAILKFNNPLGFETKDYLGRRRYRVSNTELVNWNRKYRILHKETGTDILMCFYLYFELLNEEDKNTLLGIFKKIKIKKIKNQKQLKTCLSEISDNIFAAGRYIVPNWNKFVGINLLCDYELETPEIIDSTIQDWFIGGPTYTTNSSLDRETWYDYYKKALKIVIRKNFKFKPKNLKWEDLLRRKILNYGNTGASKYMLDPEFEKSKWNSVTNMDVEKLIKEIKERKATYSNVFIKREPKKARGVVNAEFLFFILGDLFLDGKQERFKDSKFAYMLDSAANYDALFRKIKNMDGVKCFLPMDQSNFDKQIELEMITLLIDELASYMLEVSGVEWSEDINFLRDKMKLLTNNFYIKNSKGEYIKSLKGMPSGIRGTIDYDSIISAACSEMSMVMSGVKLLEDIYQGDDISPMVKNSQEALTFLDVHKYKTGISSIHPSKSFVDVFHDEFLRKGSDRDGVYAYPARMIHSLVVSNPAKSTKLEDEADLSAVIGDWVKLINRGMNPSNVIRHLVRDVKQKLNYKGPSDMIYNYLFTPVSAGGYGLESLDRIKFWVKLDIIIEEIPYDKKIYNRKRDKLLKRFGALYDFTSILKSLMAVKNKYIYKFSKVRMNKIRTSFKGADNFKLENIVTVVGETVGHVLHHEQVWKYNEGENLVALEMECLPEDYPDIVLSQRIVSEYTSKLSCKSDFFNELQENKKIKVIDKYNGINKNKFTKNALRIIYSQKFGFPHLFNYCDSFVSMCYKKFVLSTVKILSTVVSRVTSSVLNVLLAYSEAMIRNIINRRR